MSLGGNLYQDLPIQMPYGVPHRDTTHTIFIDAGSKLGNIMSAAGFEASKDGNGLFNEYIALTVNSYPYQAIKLAAPWLRVIAKAPDGISSSKSISILRFLPAKAPSLAEAIRGFCPLLKV
ncbi:MAG: gamma-glutamyl-gamma-aminobutyrate hydrolase family protein [Bacteroidales bacterium]|nr:gamma-glutamyl-gamma-aminobutyrate hydrolase family protein [Bacteroidales bacterium]